MTRALKSVAVSKTGGDISDQPHHSTRRLCNNAQLPSTFSVTTSDDSLPHQKVTIGTNLSTIILNGDFITQTNMVVVLMSVILDSSLQHHKQLRPEIDINQNRNVDDALLILFHFIASSVHEK